jgi:hypothetical protein
MQGLGKPSACGELWYAEAASPTGPWGKAVKILSHQNHTFYNPRLHLEFTSPDSTILIFECTFTVQFAERPNPTPRYDYNPILYRLDLNDPALKAAVQKTDLTFMNPRFHGPQSGEVSPHGPASINRCHFLVLPATPPLLELVTGPRETRLGVPPHANESVAAIERQHCDDDQYVFHCTRKLTQRAVKKSRKLRNVDSLLPSRGGIS